LVDLAAPSGEDDARRFFHVARSLATLAAPRSLPLLLVTNGVFDVSGAEEVNPDRALLLGPARVLSQENPAARCRVVDVIPAAPGPPGEELRLQQLLAEAAASDTEVQVAYRAHQRWVPSFHAVRLGAAGDRTRLRRGGTYVVTGGLGGVGLALAEYLAQAVQARLAL